MHFKRADFDAAPHNAHLCSEHFDEYDFTNFIGGGGDEGEGMGAIK